MFIDYLNNINIELKKCIDECIFIMLVKAIYNKNLINEVEYNKLMNEI